MLFSHLPVQMFFIRQEHRTTVAMDIIPIRKILPGKIEFIFSKGANI